MKTAFVALACATGAAAFVQPSAFAGARVVAAQVRFLRMF
jgi:hypothetical protein